MHHSAASELSCPFKDDLIHRFLHSRIPETADVHVDAFEIRRDCRLRPMKLCRYRDKAEVVVAISLGLAVDADCAR